MRQRISGLGEHASNNAPNLISAGQKPQRCTTSPRLSEGLFPLLTDAVSEVSFGQRLLPVVLLWREVIFEEEA